MGHDDKYDHDYKYEKHGDKYDHDYKHDGYGDYKKHVSYAKSYKYEPEYYEEYEEPSYGKYEEYDHKPTYKHKSGDSYGKSYSTYSSYKPSYRHKRSTVREGLSG